MTLKESRDPFIRDLLTLATGRKWDPAPEVAKAKGAGGTWFGNNNTHMAKGYTINNGN